MFKSAAQIPCNRESAPSVVRALDVYNQLKHDETRLDQERQRLSELLNSSNAGAHATKVAKRQLDKVTDELYDVRAKLVEARKVLDDARMEASRAIAVSRRPEYTAIVSKTRDAILTLQSAMQEEIAFRHRLNAAGSGFEYGDLQLMGLNLDFTGWLADAREFYSV